METGAAYGNVPLPEQPGILIACEIDNIYTSMKTSLDHDIAKRYWPGITKNIRL